MDANDSSGESGSGGGLAGFSRKLVIVLPVVGDADDAEGLGVLPADRQRRDRHPGIVLQVLGDDLPHVHPVDVVGTDDDHEVRVVVVDQVHRLVDRVGRPGVPVRAEPLLRRDRRHVVAKQVDSRHVVVMCRSRLWLLYWVSTHIRRIPALARFDSAKSIEPVYAAERHGWLGPVVGQRRQPGAGPARQHDPQDCRLWQLSSSRGRDTRVLPVQSSTQASGTSTASPSVAAGSEISSEPSSRSPAALVPQDHPRHWRLRIAGGTGASGSPAALAQGRPRQVPRRPAVGRPRRRASRLRVRLSLVVRLWFDCGSITRSARC